MLQDKANLLFKKLRDLSDMHGMFTIFHYIIHLIIHLCYYP